MTPKTCTVVDLRKFPVPAWCALVRRYLAGDVRAGSAAKASVSRFSRRIARKAPR